VEVPPFEEWLAECPYSQARKEELRTVEANLRGLPPTTRRASHVDSFPKLESYPEYKEARWINSRSDEFKVYSGPAFKAIESELYKHKQFIKHVPVPDRPALIRALRRDGLHYYENDFKAFESHFKHEVMRVLECRLYMHALRRYPALARYICKTITGINRLHTRAGVRINLRARRMSGDMCTSLGNGFSNLMLALYIAYLKKGHLDGFVEGDDGIFATDFEMSAQDYLNLGFNVEIGEVADPCLAHFCGMTMTDDGTIIKDPRRVFQTFGWTSSNINAGSKVIDELLRAKALSLAYELPQCPILGMLARVALDLTDGCAARAEQTYRPVPESFLITAFSPSEAAREMMARLFHIDREVQLAAEEAIQRHDLCEVARLIPSIGAKSGLDIHTYYQQYVEYG
jgi:hypothetical protein